MKKFDSILEDMKTHFNANDMKLKKILGNSEENKEDIKKLKVCLQDYEKSNISTKEKVSKIKEDSESN